MKKIVALFILALFLFVCDKPVNADLPIPYTQEEMDATRALRQVDDIYIHYGNGYVDKQEMGEKSGFGSALVAPHLKIANKMIESRLREVLSNLKEKKSYNIHFSKPDQNQESIDVTYQYDVSKVSLGGREFLIGTIQFNLKYLPSNPCEQLSACIHDFSVNFNPETFILANNLEQELEDVPQSIPEELRGAYGRSAKVDDISDTFKQAITTTTRQIESFLVNRFRRLDAFEQLPK